MKTIVVGYDETEAAKRALDRAAELAQAFGSKLIVTSVAPVMLSIGRSAGALDPTDTPAQHRAELANAQAHLQSLGAEGDVISAPDGSGQVEVQVGAFKVRVPVANVALRRTAESLRSEARQTAASGGNLGRYSTPTPGSSSAISYATVFLRPKPRNSFRTRS